MWTTANRVFLAEITAKGETEVVNTQGRVYATFPEVTLVVIAWAKGENDGSSQPFTLTYRRMTSCGFDGPVNIVRADVGARFVIFADRGDINADSVFGGYSESEATNYRTQQLIARNARPE